MKASNFVRILSTVLAVLTVVMTIPYFVPAVLAQSATPGLRYSIKDGEVVITNYTGIASTVFIPDTIEGCPVTEIGDQAFYNGYLKEITLPSGLRKIGKRAFYGCGRLQSISFPKSLRFVGEDAFMNCSDLSGVYIEDLAAYCSIYFYVSSGLLREIYSNPLSYAKELYLNGEPLRKLVIPEDVTDINGLAFVNCTGIESVTLPKGITEVGYNAFLGCSNISEVHISDLDSFCKIKFYNAESNPLSMARRLYVNGDELKEAVIPKGMTSISQYTFYNCKSLESITVPEGVLNIYESAFYGCSSLKSVSIPASLKQIYSGAFLGCNELSTVYYASSEEDFAAIAVGSSNNSFNEAEVVCDHVSLPPGLEYGYELGEVMITDYTGSEEELIIPATINGLPVTTIVNSAFWDCKTLKKIVLPDGIERIGNYAFNDCVSLESIHIPASVTDLGVGVTAGCSSLSQITVDPENTVYHSDGNCIIDTEEKTVVAGCKKSIIPSDASVTAIGKYAFYKCTLLNRIRIPKDITAIGDNAFSNCHKLDTVYYYGDEDSRNAMVVGSNNVSFVNAAVVYTKDILIGDVDGDGKLTGMDSNMIKRMAVIEMGFEAGSPAPFAADVNGDTTISSIDTNLLKRMIAGV